MSMSPEIMKRYIRLPTARDIWKAMSKAFYDGADELPVFTLNQRAFFAKQNDRPLSIYYGELTEIFSELDHRDKVVMVDETDITSYQKLLQRPRVHIFLVGLEGDFEQVRGEILRKDPIPELEECYALVRREDVRRGVMNRQLENSEASAMVTRNRSNQNWSLNISKTKKSPSILILLMVATNHHTNALTMIKLVIQKIDAMNLWDIWNGGIIAVIPESRIPRRPLLL